MRRATTDEDRRPAIAVTSRAAPLLAIELLAGALHIAAFAGGTSRTTALFELPGHDAVQDVGAGVDTEDIVVKIDVRAGILPRVDIDRKSKRLNCSHLSESCIPISARKKKNT